MISSTTARADLADRILLVYTLGRARKKRHLPGRTRLLKTLFKTEVELRDQDIGSPSYEFYRWNHGPFSKRVYQDLTDLTACGLSSDTRASARGVDLAAYLRRALESTPGWSEAFSTLDRAQDFFKRKTALQAKKWSHDLVVDLPDLDKPTKIHDLPLCWDIITPREDDGWAPLAIPDEVSEAFAIATAYNDEDIEEMRQPSQVNAESLHGGKRVARLRLKAVR